MTFQKTKRMLRGCLALVFSAAVLCGCQPTPEEPIVVSKNDGQLEESIEAEAVAEVVLESDEVWKEEFSSFDNTAQIKIDAVVETSEATALPVVECAPHYFTEDEANRAIKLLYGETPLFDNSTDTKENIERLLFEEKMNLESVKETGEYPIREDGSRPVVTNVEEEISYIEHRIKLLEEDYAKATQEISELDAIGFKTIYDGAETINIRDDKDPRHQMYVFNDKNANDAAMLYEFVDKRYMNKHLLSQGEDINIEISRNDAETIAKNALNEIGILDCEIISASSAQINGNPCYMFELSRSINNVPCREFESYSQNIALGVDGEDYRAPWNQETIQIVVNEEGIIEFNWEFPCKVFDTINENVAIKPYEEIQSIAREQLERLLAADEFAINKEEKTVYINRIVLNYMRIAKKNEIDQYYYLPVWDFIGEVTKNGTEFDVDRIPMSNISFLTLNAIDGSVINRELGY